MKEKHNESTHQMKNKTEIIIIQTLQAIAIDMTSLN